MIGPLTDWPIGRAVIVVALATLSAGCSTLPAFGPSSDDIVKAADQKTQTTGDVTKFHLIDVTSSSLPKLTEGVTGDFPQAFIDQTFLFTDESINTGDLIEVHIWEAADDGLFASSGQRETVFSLIVSNSGKIEVPYAGIVPVAGKTTSEARQMLLARYKGKAVDPEIHVQIKETTARSVTVLGVAREPGRVTIPPSGIRLLDLVAPFGGSTNPAWELKISLTRSATSGSLSLTRILDDASNNVVVLPGDTIQIDNVPRRFAVYGAVSQPGNITLMNARPSLSDLLAESGGRNDMRAEPNSVFVFRPRQGMPDAANKSPLAYRLNFARPDAFLLASQFAMHPSDIVYVATADASEFNKFVTTLLSPFLGSVGKIQNMGN